MAGIYLNEAENSDKFEIELIYIATDPKAPVWQQEVTLYSEPSYKGKSKSFKIGNHDIIKLFESDFNDFRSSKIPQGLGLSIICKGDDRDFLSDRTDISIKQIVEDIHYHTRTAGPWSITILSPEEALETHRYLRQMEKITGGLAGAPIDANPGLFKPF